MSCAYPGEGSHGPLILLERGRQQTSASWAPGPGRQTAGSRRVAAPAGGLADEQLRHVYFFDVFVRRNSFTGGARTCGDEVKALAGLHSQQGSHLYHAMLALGALYAVQLQAADGPGSRGGGLLAALGYYSKAVSDLRLALDAQGGRRQEEQRRTCILWTTLLLGLFEVSPQARPLKQTLTPCPSS